MRASPNSTDRPHRAAASAATPVADPQRGIALVLTLIFSILLYILVAELVVSGRLVRATGQNDALLARMRTQMLFQLGETEEQLLADLGGEEQEGEGGGPGGLAGALGSAASSAGSGVDPAAGGEGGEGEAPPDPASQCDCSRDAWFEPVAHADNDLSTYVWVEDENRKLNLLALWSPDEKFALTSKQRLVRLIDALREDSDFDVSTSDAERIAQELLDWGKRSGTDSIPRPRLKSDDEKRRDISAPMHLDELLMLPSVTEELFYDKVFEGKVYLGLESVLTLWTSLKVDKGNPEKTARLRAAAQARGEKPKEGGEAPAGGADGTSGSAGGGSGTAGTQPGTESEAPVQPDGQGIRININTASRAVLRSLFPPERIPDRVIDAIIKHRNEVDEEAQKAAEEAANSENAASTADFGDLRLGEQAKLKVFVQPSDLEQVEEFAKIADPEAKQEFLGAVTTTSEVFTIHLTSLFKRSDEHRVYVLRRCRSIVLRVDDGAEGQIIPLVPFEERGGMRVKPVDLQTDERLDLSRTYLEMDQFAQEERAWNPFLIDFYLPKDQRDEFYRPR